MYPFLKSETIPKDTITFQDSLSYASLQFFPKFFRRIYFMNICKDIFVKETYLPPVKFNYQSSLFILDFPASSLPESRHL